MRSRLTFTRKQQFISPAVTAVKPYELELSLAAILVLSGVYIAYELLAEPRGGHPFGHTLGIIGAVMMLMTETLYSLRKRTTLLNWAGPVRYWLSFHIFTGIVGPFLVLMHTGLQFRGLAGISFLLTITVVASGFLGRYLYTALPRTLSGVTTSRREMEAEITAIQTQLERWQAQRPLQEQQITQALSQPPRQRTAILNVFGRTWYQWRYRQRLKKELRHLNKVEAAQKQQLTSLLTRKRELERQTIILESARRLLRAWHILHIPVGMALFFSVFIHILATVYFRAGLFK